jgi:glutamate racemase
MSNDPRPIGIFDSGIGGLTVLKSLLTEFPNESFIYLGDTARLPYGSKSPETIEKYLKQNVEFLISRDVKAVIVACNSASTVLLKSASIEKSAFSIPVYDVIQPGAKAALATSLSKRIGVLGTSATIKSLAYAKVLTSLDPNVLVYQQACPLLVPLVEEGWHDDPLTNLIIYRYIAPLAVSRMDTLILGCTHYPALRDGIQKVVGPGVALVDSASAILHELNLDIAQGHLVPALKSTLPRLKILTTDASSNFKEIADRLLHPHHAPEFEAIDLI